MIHGMRTVGANLHFEDRVSARRADAFDGNSRGSQILSEPPVIDREIDVVANPLWRKFHGYPVIPSEVSTSAKRKGSRSRRISCLQTLSTGLSRNSHDVRLFLKADGRQLTATPTAAKTLHPR